VERSANRYHFEYPRMTLVSGNSIYAALTAVLAANLVLGAYIASSVSEDRKQAKATAAQKKPSTPESKKDR
jgi:hypothetical protein